MLMLELYMLIRLHICISITLCYFLYNNTKSHIQSNLEIYEFHSDIDFHHVNAECTVIIFIEIVQTSVT